MYRCIYEYDAEHTIGGKGFKEDETPNFTGSYYSDTKGMVEKVRVLFVPECVGSVQTPLAACAANIVQHSV